MRRKTVLIHPQRGPSLHIALNVAIVAQAQKLLALCKLRRFRSLTQTQSTLVAAIAAEHAPTPTALHAL